MPLAERHCSWCQKEGKPSFLGYTETCDGSPTHGMCRRHFEQLMREAGATEEEIAAPLAGENVTHIEEYREAHDGV